MVYLTVVHVIDMVTVWQLQCKPVCRVWEGKQFAGAAEAMGNNSTFVLYNDYGLLFCFVF